ncbi:MAG TPA: GyrI-like domain-containing protein [Patescibacteria group bacterium]|nr:GyrI-like domain-containing protein [Patescibacteria group bacterium]
MPATLAPQVTFERGDDLRRLASARRDRVRFVMLPPARFLAIDGTDVPGSPEYIGAIGALFGTAYPLHFLLKGRGVNEPVGMLEALYWFTPEQLLGSETTDAGSDMSRDWRWRLLIAVPDATTRDEVAVAARSGKAGPWEERIVLDDWTEGPSAQILHVGPYGDQGASLRKLHGAIAAAGLRPIGPHHEIYLHDPHRVGEDRARTVLRQPVTEA